MRFMLMIPLALTVIFFLGAYSCTNNQRPGNDKIIFEKKGQEPSSIKREILCESDEDCTTIKADCCGCHQGGAQKAIAIKEKAHALTRLKEQCQDTMCIQMMSTDESCKKKSLCKSGSCVLE